MDATVLVTGGLGGIGWAVASRLARAGQAVEIADVSSVSQDMEARIAAYGGLVRSTACDLADPGAVDALFDTARDRGRCISGIVAAAGIEPRASVQDMDVETFRRAMDVNVLGSFLPVQALARRMLAGECRGSASVVFLSSVNAQIATSKHAAYGASKGAIAQLTRVLAVELAPLGIRVNAVAPGTVRTRLLDQLLAAKPHALDGILQRTPLKRIAEPEEVASLVTYLLGDEAGYITGQQIFVDGGRTAQNLPD